MKISFLENSQWIIYWIENHPHLIHYSNVKESFFVKINGTLVKKQKHLIKISVRELHDDMMLPISEGDYFGTITVDGK